MADTIFLYPTTLAQFGNILSLPHGTTLAGVPNILSYARVTGQTAPNPAIATYLVGSADESLNVCMAMNVLAATTIATKLAVTYTDETGTARQVVFPVTHLIGNFTAAGAVSAVGPWATPSLPIRAKAGTLVTLRTLAGTFTGVTYSCEGTVLQVQ